MRFASILKVGLTAAAVSLTPAPAFAAELFGGVYVHDVDTPLTKSGIEDGGDFQIGVRGGRIGLTPLQPYAFASLNSSGDTSYAAVGLSAKFGDAIYIRPGLGLAIHTGSDANFENPFNDKIEFGSRVLFEPELGVGVRVAPRITAEASWVHLSHAQLFGRQNPGVDNIGVRLNLGL
jgi:hypothetical protein